MGKGRPKGYTPYADITYEELGDWLGRKSIVKVSKAWLEELTSHSATLNQVTKPQKPILTPKITEVLPKISYKLIDLHE